MCVQAYSSPLLPEGQKARIIRVSDQESEKLCYLGQLGLYPGSPIEMISRAPFGGPISVRVGEASEQSEQIVGRELAEHIIVTAPHTEELPLE